MKDKPMPRANCQIINCQNLEEMFQQVKGAEIPKKMDEAQVKQITEIAFAFAEENKRYYK